MNTSNNSIQAKNVSWGMLSFGVLIFYWGLSVFNAQRLGVTLDEPTYIGAGHALIAHGVLFLNPFHPFLIKALTGLGVFLFSTAHSPYNAEYYSSLNTFSYPYVFLSSNAGSLESIVFSGRLAVITFNTILLGFLLVYLREWKGKAFALGAICMIAFGPTFIAHSSLSTSDVSCTLLILIVISCYAKLLERPSVRNGLEFTIWNLMGMLSKFNFLLIHPVICLSLIILWIRGRSIARPAGIYLITLIVGLSVISCVYEMGLSGIEMRKTRSYETRLRWEGSEVSHKFVKYLHETNGTRGLSWYLAGVISVINHQSIPRKVPVILGDKSYIGGMKSYFPRILLGKESEAFILALSVLLMGVMVRVAPRVKNFSMKWIDKFIQTENLVCFVSVVFVFLYLWVSLCSNLNIGVRHILPVIGLSWIIVFSSGYVVLKRKAFTISMFLLGVLQCSSVFSQWPHLISFNNYFRGGASASQLNSLDSNFDWGQDSLQLLNWSESQKIKTIYTDITSSVDLNWYGRSIKVIPIKFHEIGTLMGNEIVAIGRQQLRATELSGDLYSKESLKSALASLKEVNKIGATIVVYRTVRSNS